jgi:hypothetical protein
VEVLDTVAVAREEERKGWLDVVSMAGMALPWPSLAIFWCFLGMG